MDLTNFAARRLSLFTILLLLALCYRGSPADASSRTDIGFRSAARAVIHSLLIGDYHSFNRYASTNAVEVVERTCDWDRMDKENDETFDRAAGDFKGGDLSMTGIESIVWQEREADFAPADLNDEQFRFILKQFHGLVINSSECQPYWPNASLNTVDNWGERHLGPAITGKIASNEYWYIYMDREHGKWKVWRMELDVH